MKRWVNKEMSVWEDEHKGGQRLDVYIKVGGGTRGRATDKEGLRLECSISNRSAKMQAPEA